jgi:RNA polymerase sigma factor (TIGR02999 family)
MPLVYDQLRRMAARYVARERPGHVLQSTALVHEAFLKLVDQRNVDWQNRSHFYGLAARMMRRILVDQARQAHRSKRGAGVTHVSIEDANLAAATPLEPVDVLTLDDALQALQAMDSTQARLVELRFFGGLTINETAEALGLSVSTAKREWSVARAWLYRRISGHAPADSA